MIQIVPEAEDAQDFIEQIGRLANGIVRHHDLKELFLIKVDNWFGQKWLGFAGKTLGALGVWKRRPTVPPFVPSRIVWQRRFVAPGYTEDVAKIAIHVRVSSDLALGRDLEEVVPGAGLLWFSDRTKSNGRGSAMAYIPIDGSIWCLWVGWSQSPNWKPVQLKGIGIDELYTLMSVPCESNQR